ncbi:MAG: LysM peptidoglycan-binding domain-containing protein [Clostridiales bacterium]|nr:LysM peptidoglycan-binding domain-containing protein [Clostridiales bacterium]
MELIERQNAKEERKLPKNIRQIGEPGEGMKILVEDYTYTYLHQTAEANLTCIKTLVLVGRVEEPFGIYIQGALEVDMGQDMKGWFSHEHWRNIFQTIQTWFDGLEVVGWCMANPGFPPVLTEELRTVHAQNFSGRACVFLQMDVLENEAVFYMRGENGLAPLCGYYIYYEKNDMMQAYMSQQRGGMGIEPEGIIKDRAAARFRNVMQEKREQNTQKKVMALLYTSCTFLVMVILVIGVTTVNNYDRMVDMEDAIHQISENLGPEEELPVQDMQEIELAAAEENQKALDEKAEEAQPEDTPADEEEQAPQPEAVEEPQPEETETGDSSEPGPVQQETGEETQAVMSESVKEPEKYRVQTGDTLLDISRERYGTEDMVDKICEINGLDDSDKIYIGEIILLP